ncbi:nuclear pore complex protein Nup214-like [Contarinia nasturtii]|uniref:nuclear pore complex protein Nup214-like n=1 Tax=Contarinia nasturtii TaxID=265458 RepID=UPI0012D47CD9|nr:nuclear pore complex protein Nup214-like [Contarinia nasturtii]
MALQEAPVAIDVTDIQFKVHSKYQLFNVNASTPNYNGIDLLAAASNFGLVIVGRPTAQEIQVLRLKDVTENKESPTIPTRIINLPGEPYMLAVSCDHSMLSVCYTVNGTTFIDIYAVQSFLSTNVQCILSKIMVSNANSVKVNQILWNPVIANTMALCLSDGTLTSYLIKANSFEFNALDKAENARCACWSPKGKQIVVAFPNGKLAQYKPDLKLAKAIPCATQIFAGPFYPIAIQWLSTYQFAVVFVENKEEANQSLFIINTSKTAPPTYINYYDITFSQTGPRAPQVFLVHILQWNILLMASSNGTEIGILGTTESGENPLWKQYTFIDEGRAELPLTADKQDTFPIGLALDTGCTHQLTIGENLIPVMPMLHILSTHGFILSFDMLNFQPTRVDICSPPQNISDQSGLGFFKQNATAGAAQKIMTTPPSQQPNAARTSSSNDFHVNNLTFAIPETGATSTPAKQPQSMQTKPTFGLQTTEAQQPKPAMSSLFGAKQTIGFGSSGLGGPKELPKPFGQPTMQPAPTPASASPSVIPQNSAVKVSSEASKPFLTVQSTYKPVPQAAKNPTSSIVSNSENDALLRKLIKEEIEAFDTEIRAALNRSKNVQINICGKEELSKLIKNIDEMQEITTQATESTESIKVDVNSLRLTLYEMHAMMAEAQSKIEEFNKIGKTSDGNLAANQTHRRLINKLQNQLAQNQARFDVFSKQLDANWSAHLQNQRENDKARMRIPTLENVYQTLEQQHQILMKEKAKISKIKSKIGGRDSSPSKIKYSYSKTDNLKMNSLVDSVLSLTISDQIRSEQKPLNASKLDALRKATLSSRKINVIKPSRPDRQGINSEIIIEKKLAHAKAQKEKENLKKAELEAERARQEELTKQKDLAKPKPLLPTPTTQPVAAAAAAAAAPFLSKPKEVIDKQPLTVTPALPSSTGSSLFGSKQLFGSSQIGTTTVPAKSFDTKSIFSSDQPKSQLSFGISAEKPPAQKSEPTTNQSTGLSKTVSFNTAATAPSGFAFGTKPEPTETVPSSTKSTGFSFGASTPQAFGSMSQMKSDGSMPSVSVSQPKPALLQTPTSTNKEPTLLRNAPIIATGVNISPKQTTKTPLLATPPNIQPQQTNVQSTVTTTSSPFKFNMGNTFAATTTPDKSKSDKENAPIAVSVTSAPNTSSIGNFSFLSGLSSTSTPPTKSNTPSTVSTVQAANVSSPISVASNPTVVSSTPSSIGFSFAKASTEPSIFGGTQTGATTTTTSTVATTAANVITSSSDVGSIFKGFNICKPNVVDTSNAGKSPFGGNETKWSLSGLSGGDASSPTTTSASVFGSIAQSPSTSAQASPFVGKSITTSASTLPTTSTTTSIFGAKSPDTTPSQPAAGTNVFGAKSVESASVSFGGFGISSTPPSSAASPSAASAGNLFGSVPAPTSAGNIFGGAIGSSNTSTASIFGGSTPTSPQAGFGSSVFSNANTTTNIFGGAASTSSSTSASMFGGTATNPSSGGSLFGGSGFSSPQQPSSGFGLSAIAAQSNHTFGSSATFGSAPAFGSPTQKGGGFGTFANTNPIPSFTTPPKSNSLFESLGSSDNAMTFGNLAQNAAAAPKQFSGGTSFSSWR